jgi:membrane fusion protein (multidrug efflux system)
MAAGTTHAREDAPDSGARRQSSSASTDAQGEQGDKAPADKPKPMATRTKIIIAVVAVVAVLGGLIYYLHSRGYEDTDDAEIDGNISSVSARVSGTVVAVHVVENQNVKKGDPLVELDPTDLDVAVAEAKATLAQAEANLEAEDPNVPIAETSTHASRSSAGTDLASSIAGLAVARADIQQQTAALVQAEANARTADLEKARSTKLMVAGAVAPSEYDNRFDTAVATAAAVEASRQSLAAAKAREDENAAKVEAARVHLEEVKTNAPRQVASHRATVAVRKANVELARAQLTQAELNRSYATVTAPVDGIIGRKSVNVGDRVSPGQELMALSNIADLWVTANFRETQLEKMHVNQTVKLHVDALGLDFTGVVYSVGGATGSRYSVLPPENATGNYVKVVQRIPVRIRLDPGQPGYDRLREGMSVEPKVHLR